MRKALKALLVSAAVLGGVIAAAFVYEKRDNADRVMRAQAIVHELQMLEVGKSDYAVANAIVMKFGSAPPPDGATSYQKENCAAQNHDQDNCFYLMLMNDSPVEALLNRHYFLRRWGFHPWSGSAMISLRGGKVNHYDFIVWYMASNGQLRGFELSENQSAPRFEEGAHLSDSYSVLPFKTVHTSPILGIGLNSALTPSANATERQRASHIDFACLAKKEGCGEVCTIMPEAWEDYYKNFGQREVERHGPNYILCSEPPR